MKGGRNLSIHRPISIHLSINLSVYLIHPRPNAANSMDNERVDVPNAADAIENERLYAQNAANIMNDERLYW